MLITRDPDVTNQVVLSVSRGSVLTCPRLGQSIFQKLKRDSANIFDPTVLKSCFTGPEQEWCHAKVSLHIYTNYTIK